MARGRFRESDDFGGFGATGQIVTQGNEAAGKRWYKIYKNTSVTPLRYEWEAMNETGVLQTGTAATKTAADNAARVAMRSLAVSKGLIPASTIAPKAEPIIAKKAVPVTPAVVVKPTMTDIKFWV
jgi:hypothetical protein